LEQQHENGGWGFHHKGGVDADSTSSCMMFLMNEGMLTDSELKRNSDILLNSQNPDGGIGTYSARSIEFEIQKKNQLFAGLPIERYKGWCSSDTYVSAMVVLALLKCDVARDLPALEHIIRFIQRKQLASGCWNAYWSNGKMIATSYCIEALTRASHAQPTVERGVKWLLAGQTPEGAWTDGVAETSTPYDTALAIKALLSLPMSGDDVGSAVKQGIQWLVAHQREDGSWESYPFMTAPRPWDDEQLDNHKILPAAKDENRLFATATVVSALAAYSVRSFAQREHSEA
jgi:squalene-hopene/tetraprenyl-beta-curcumene cyclase